MGFRFRRTLKIMPGVRLNVGMRGVSVSVGGRGARTTVGRQGVRTTVGLPGTGLSYTHLDKWSAPRSTARPRTSSTPSSTRPATVGQSIAAALSFAAYLASSVWTRWRNRKALSAPPVVAPAATLPPATLPASQSSVAPVRASVKATPSSVAPDPEAAAYVTCARALRYADLCESPDAVRALLTSGVGAPVSELSAALGLSDHEAVVTLLNRATAKRG